MIQVASLIEGLEKPTHNWGVVPANAQDCLSKVRHHNQLADDADNGQRPQFHCLIMDTDKTGMSWKLINEQS